jgi:hypothetical protein
MRLMDGRGVGECASERYSYSFLQSQTEKQHDTRSRFCRPSARAAITTAESAKPKAMEVVKVATAVGPKASGAVAFCLQHWLLCHLGLY